MIRSMTGYGRASASIGEAVVVIEVRTLNHRHADISVRMPRNFPNIEQDVRRLAKETFSRGKIDIALTYSGDFSSETQIRISRSAIDNYLSNGKEIAEKFGLGSDLSLEVLLTLPGVVRSSEISIDMSSYDDALLGTLSEALSAADQMRKKEGAVLEAELRAQLDRIKSLVNSIDILADVVVEAVRERLRKRVDLLRQETGILDDARLHHEVVIASDKMDIREELVRLSGHAEAFSETLSSNPAPVGRRLEFLLQEMGREANTIGSKAADVSLSHLVVDLKTELERIREQVQNVE